MTIRQFVLDRLNDGKSIESIWRELDGHWNYINRLRREWEREQAVLRHAIKQEGSNPSSPD